MSVRRGCGDGAQLLPTSLPLLTTPPTPTVQHYGGLVLVPAARPSMDIQNHNRCGIPP